MVKIIGGIISLYILVVGNVIFQGIIQEFYWKCFFDGYGLVKEWLVEVKFDLVIVVYNDYGLNFFLDKVFIFVFGCVDIYENVDEGWGLKLVLFFIGDVKLLWYLVEFLIEQEFDICMCQEMKVDYGFVNFICVLFGDQKFWLVKVILLVVNIVQYLVFSVVCCLKLGKVLGKVLEFYLEDICVVILGIGGMFYQL